MTSGLLTSHLNVSGENSYFFCHAQVMFFIVLHCIVLSCVIMFSLTLSLFYIFRAHQHHEFRVT